MRCQTSIEYFILWIQNQKDQIETWQQRVWQLHIVNDIFILIPLRFRWICSGQNWCACIQLTNDTGFCNAQCLLFHYLVQDATRWIVHFVKFINATDTIVGQYERTTVNSNRFCFYLFVKLINGKDDCQKFGNWKHTFGVQVGVFLDLL